MRARAGRAEGGGEKYKRMWCRGTPALKDLGGSCRGTLWQAPDSFPPTTSFSWEHTRRCGMITSLRLAHMEMHLAGTDWTALWSVALTVLWKTHCFIHTFSLTGLGWMVTVTVWLDTYGCIVNIFLRSGSLNKELHYLFSVFILNWTLKAFSGSSLNGQHFLTHLTEFVSFFLLNLFFYLQTND